MDYLYPCTIESDNQGHFTVRFPDLPEVKVDCTSVHGVLKKASTALISALNRYILAQANIPAPSVRQTGQRTIFLPPTIEQKILVYQTLRTRGLSYAAIAKKLGKTEIMIMWLVDLLKDTDPKDLRAVLRELEIE
jgi:antitoxin HicB